MEDPEQDGHRCYRKDATYGRFLFTLKNELALGKKMI